mmetsp:Transcript_3342/g.6971  ORF Transcript_3342/g.6971 Transcript_3342/m.6971 type:complete len:214 (+) Transcript_3342:1022-1663(+)
MIGFRPCTTSSSSASITTFRTFCLGRRLTLPFRTYSITCSRTLRRHATVTNRPRGMLSSTGSAGTMSQTAGCRIRSNRAVRLSKKWTKSNRMDRVYVPRARSGSAYLAATSPIQRPTGSAATAVASDQAGQVPMVPPAPLAVMLAAQLQSGPRSKTWRRSQKVTGANLGIWKRQQRVLPCRCRHPPMTKSERVRVVHQSHSGALGGSPSQSRA